MRARAERLAGGRRIPWSRYVMTTPALFVIRLIVLALFLVAWEAASGTLLPRFWVSSPSAIFAVLQRWIVDGSLWMHLQATLTAIAAGYVIGCSLGVGVGYLEPEFRAVGANFPDRGAVTEGFLDAMSHLWYDQHPEYHGRFADFAGVDAYPRPVQERIPLVVGGHAPPAYRRAVARGDGWYGFALTPEDTATCLAGLRAAAGLVERPTSLGPLEITVTPRGRLTADVAAVYAELGVSRLVPMPPPHADGVSATIDWAIAAVARL